MAIIAIDAGAATKTLKKAHQRAIKTGQTQTIWLEGGVEVRVDAHTDLDELIGAFWRSFYSDRSPVGPCSHPDPAEHDCTLVPRLRAMARSAPGRGLDHLWSMTLDSAVRRIEWLEAELAKTAAGKE